MNRYHEMLHSLEAGDPDSALVFWDSKQWPDEDRAKLRRLVKAATAVLREVL